MPISNLQLTPQFVQAVRDAVDIVEVASGYTKLARAGKKWKGLCPLHKEKTPSFNVDADLGFFKCFGCGAGGDAIKLHMLLTGDDFATAMESLANRFGVPLPARAATHRGPRKEREQDPEAVLEAAAEWFRGELLRSEFARSLPRAAEDPARARRALRPRLRAGGVAQPAAGARREVPGRRPDRRRPGRAAGGGRRALRPLPPPADLPDPQRRRPPGRLRRPHARRRRRQVRQHRRDRALPARGRCSTGSTRRSGRSATAGAPSWSRVTSTRSPPSRRGSTPPSPAWARRSPPSRPGSSPASPTRWWLATTPTRPARPPAGGRSAILLPQGLAVRRSRLPAGEDPDSVRTKQGEAALPDALRPGRRPGDDGARPPGAGRPAPQPARARAGGQGGDDAARGDSRHHRPLRLRARSPPSGSGCRRSCSGSGWE